MASGGTNESSEIARLKKENEKLRKKTIGLTGSVEKYSQSCITKDKKINALSLEIQHWKNTIKGLTEGVLYQEKLNLHEKINLLEEEIQRLKGYRYEAETNEKILEELISERDEIIGDKADLGSKIRKLKIELEEITDKYEEQKKMIEFYKGKIKGYLRYIGLKIDQGALENEDGVLFSKDQEGLRNDIDFLEKKISEFSSLCKLTEENQSLTIELEKATKKASNFEEEKGDLCDTLLRVNIQKRDIELKLERLKQRYDSDVKIIDELCQKDDYINRSIDLFKADWIKKVNVMAMEQARADGGNILRGGVELVFSPNSEESPSHHPITVNDVTSAIDDMPANMEVNTFTLSNNS